MNPLQQQQQQQQRLQAAMYNNMAFQQQQQRLQQQSFAEGSYQTASPTGPWLPSDAAQANFFGRPPMLALQKMNQVSPQQAMFARSSPQPFPGSNVNNVALAAAAAAAPQYSVASPLQIQQPAAQLPTRPPVVPSATPATPQIEAIPADTETAKKNLKLYQLRDEVYQETLNEQYKRHTLLAQEKKRELEALGYQRRAKMIDPGLTFGNGYSGVGNAATAAGPNQILYPADRKRTRRTKELRL